MTDHLQAHEEDITSPTGSEDGGSDEEENRDGEFRLTVRKLEVPVRPRGVLAE